MDVHNAENALQITASVFFSAKITFKIFLLAKPQSLQAVPH